MAWREGFAGEASTLGGRVTSERRSYKAAHFLNALPHPKDSFWLDHAPSHAPLAADNGILANKRRTQQRRGDLQPQHATTHWRFQEPCPQPTSNHGIRKQDDRGTT